MQVTLALKIARRVYRQELKVHIQGINVASFKEFADDFTGESDRAAVIIGAAKIDILLYLLLKAVLKPSSSNQDSLLDGDSPLGTFSSRINLCQRLGLIEDRLASAINMIRKIRNSFAHEIHNVSLDSGSHKDRIRELAKLCSGKHDMINQAIDVWSLPNSPSGQFKAALIMITISLELGVDNATPILSLNKNELLDFPEVDETST